MLSPRSRPRIAVRALVMALATTLAASVAGLDAHNAPSRDNSRKLDAHLKQVVERNDDALHSDSNPSTELSSAWGTDVDSSALRELELLSNTPATVSQPTNPPDHADARE